MNKLNFNNTQCQFNQDNKAENSLLTDHQVNTDNDQIIALKNDLELLNYKNQY